MAQVQLPIMPGRLYRYRSLTRSADAIQQEVNSILQKYIYCAKFTDMNDPMEGFYRPSKVLSGKPNYNEIVRNITDLKSNIGIACFTETYEDVLMWTHYAGNYSGMCLSYSSIELQKGLPSHVNLVRVGYVDEPPLIYPSRAINLSEAAISILSQKKYNWASEREWRILGSVGQVKIQRFQAVKAIYFGSRADLQHRTEILTSIQGTKIRAYMMDVDGYSHTWKPINTAAKKSK
jgi:hypothetical protein